MLELQRVWVMLIRRLRHYVEKNIGIRVLPESRFYFDQSLLIMGSACGFLAELSIPPQPADTVWITRIDGVLRFCTRSKNSLKKAQQNQPLFLRIFVSALLKYSIVTRSGLPSHQFYRRVRIDARLFRHDHACCRRDSSTSIPPQNLLGTQLTAARFGSRCCWIRTIPSKFVRRSTCWPGRRCCPWPTERS